MKTLDDAAREFIELFERLAIPYALMGGLAVRTYALPRPTFDWISPSASIAAT
jgi:hypothetical protein